MSSQIMKLRNNDGVKFKIMTTRNHRVYNSPYYRGVYLWERLPVDVQTSASKACVPPNDSPRPKKIGRHLQTKKSADFITDFILYFLVSFFGENR